MNVARSIMVWAIAGVIAYLAASAVIISATYVLGLYGGSYVAQWRGTIEFAWLGIANGWLILLAKPRRLLYGALLGIPIITAWMVQRIIAFHWPLERDVFLLVFPTIWATGALNTGLLTWQGQRTNWRLVEFDAGAATRLSHDKPNADRIYQLD